jgi:hypothetical protein
MDPKSSYFLLLNLLRFHFRVSPCFGNGFGLFPGRCGDSDPTMGRLRSPALPTPIPRSRPRICFTHSLWTDTVGVTETTKNTSGGQWHGQIIGGIGGRVPAPQGEFFFCDFLDPAPKGDLGTMEHPVFSLATRPDRRVLDYTHNGHEVTVTPSVKGRATIHDKDILIFCISQLMAAINAGREVSRTLQLTAHDLLTATNRDTSGDGYRRLRDAFERLAGTRITTNIATGGVEVTHGFGLIEAGRSCAGPARGAWSRSR